MASSLCQVKIGAGSYAAVAGGINVSPGDAITIKLASSAGVDTGTWSISCISTDETKVAATITALLSVNQTTFEATFTVPAGTGQALIFRSQVNGDTTTRTTFGLYTLVGALRTGAVDEVYEGSATYGWVTKLNAVIRAGGGAFTAPTGTGMMTVTGAAMDPAATVLGSGIPAWLTTPSSANLLAALTTKTGTGLAAFGTAPTFKTSIALRDPADAFSYVFTPGAIVADRILNLPVLTGTDTLVCEAHTATLTNKTFNAVDNTLSVTSGAAGDLLVHNGTKFIRLAKGTASQVLRVNAGATDIEWAAASTPTGTGLRKVVAGVEAAASALLLNADVDGAAAIAGSKISPDFSTLTTTLGGMKRTPVTNASTGAINNLALASTTTIIVFTGAGAVTLSGVAGGADGRDLTIINATGDLLTIPDSSGLSDADKRFRSPYGASTIMQDGVALDFVYSTVTNKWHTKMSF